jgi:hypothetical protein
MAIFGEDLSASSPGHFTPRERTPGTLWIRELGPRSGIDDVEEKKKKLPLPGLEIRLLGRLAHSQINCAIPAHT